MRLPTPNDAAALIGTTAIYGLGAAAMAVNAARLIRYLIRP